MSDNLRRYRAIRDGLFQLHPGEPQGRVRQKLQVLAMYVNGIVGSKSTNTRSVAMKTPTGAKVPSRQKQLVRWYQDENVCHENHMLPFVEDLLVHLSEYTLFIAIDGSDVGRNCITLMVSVLYQNRALPLVWLVRKGKKGHFPSEMHTELLSTFQKMLPEGASVVLLGDGEFDNIDLQRFANDAGWSYVCRTAKNTIVELESGEIGHLEEIDLWPGACLPLYDVLFTRQRYGPLLAIAWWRKDCREPLYLITNIDLVDEACRYYRKRMKIETFFSDQKSRGFQLHKSHISNPERLNRVMIAACLSYIWMIYLGNLCLSSQWREQIHRTDRCDLSLFQLGLDLLEHWLNEGLPLCFNFRLPVHNPWTLNPAPT